MRDLGYDEATGSACGVGVALPSAAEILEVAEQISRGDSRGMTDAERVDFLAAGEVLKCVVEGAQAEATLRFDASQRSEQARAGVPAERQSRGIAAQIGLARRGSHHRGVRWQHLAQRLGGMPETFAAFRAGRISEFKASIIARITECLAPDLREKVDLAIAGDPEWLESLGERELEAEVSKLAYRFDPRSFVERAAQAAKDRRVTSRPAPDTMMWLTTLLPVVQGAATYGFLHRWAVAQQTAGDPRSINQLMADRLVELVTGQAAADQVPITVDLMIADTTLLGLDQEPARIPGYGPIPAAVAIGLFAIAQEQGLATLRRLYTHPTNGRLVKMESVARKFPGALAALIRKRDQRCRSSWCDAPIRDSDHPKRRADGGVTSYLNGQGLCEACNIAKEAAGWAARPRPGPAGLQDPHTVETTTPTGHVYTSVAPQVGLVRVPLSMEIYVAEDFGMAS